MAGQTNSWITTLQTTSVPCIGTTVNGGAGGSNGLVLNEDGSVATSLQEGAATCMWWIMAALAVGYLLKGKRRQQ